MTLEPSTPDLARLEDLATFARLMTVSADTEPWAQMIWHLHDMGALTDEERFWMVKLYNSYDSFHSAWSVFRRWPDPYAWVNAPDRLDCASYECTQERRNLRGGKVIHHLLDYVHHLAGQTQRAWLSQPVLRDSPERDFVRVTDWTRQIWGVGRQTAFEWAEFAGKCCELPISAGDAQLWESEGPRRSLQRLYGNPNPSRGWLDARAVECRDFLAARGVDLPWWDFETIICDFNVMRDGRYYVGRHLAALREEIDLSPPADHELLMTAFRRFVPERWQNIEPGIKQDLKPVYRDTGRILEDPT